MSAPKNKRGDWFCSYTGRMIFILDPTVDQVCIEDIAHSLAHQCRFAGHSQEFYSVAQHSVLVSEQLPPQLQLAGLMHDATEAYCQDLIRPIKRQIHGYAEIEQAWAEVIDTALSLNGQLAQIPSEVKYWDNALLMTERRDLVNHGGKSWNVKERPIAATIVPQDAASAERIFLFRYGSLRKGVAQ